MITSVNNGQVKNIIQLNQKTKARRERSATHQGIGFRRGMYQKLSAVMQN